MRNIYLSAESKAILKSWAKVFMASSFAVYAAGSASFWKILNAGLVAVIPVIISWLDPKDARFGRKVVIKAVVKKAVKKAVKKKA